MPVFWGDNKQVGKVGSEYSVVSHLGTCFHFCLVFYKKRKKKTVGLATWPNVIHEFLSSFDLFVICMSH